MNLESNSTLPVKPNAQSPTDCRSITTMPPTASPTDMMDNSSSQQCELSFSDLALATTPRRTSKGEKHRPCSRVALEDSSSRTATTVNSSCNNHSSSMCGSAFSHRASQQQHDDDNGNHRRPSLLSLQNVDVSVDGGSDAFSCRRRRFSCNDIEDDSSSPSSTSSSRSRDVRNLMGLQRRRSDPVTRRWREQCSKIYKEQLLLLDSCPENQQHAAPLLLPSLSPERLPREQHQREQK